MAEVGGDQAGVAGLLAQPGGAEVDDEERLQRSVGRYGALVATFCLADPMSLRSRSPSSHASPISYETHHTPLANAA